MTNPPFTINFRREMFEREVARSRQRVIHLAGWMGYFGVLALILWAYALNFRGMDQKTRRIERQTNQFVTSQNLPRKVPLDAEQVGAIERFHASPRRWRDKLSRLSVLLPGSATLQSVGVNPTGSNQPADQNKLVITGLLRAAPGDDAMRGVVQLVASLQADSAFSAGYRSIKLSQSHVDGTVKGTTQFTIECR